MSEIVRKIVKSSKLPPALGPYSQAVIVDKTMYLSGSLGVDTASGNLVSGGIAAEARQALTNIGHVLEEAGLTYKHVVKTTVLLADINDFAVLNSIYAEFFTSNHPARSTFQVAALPKNARVEIEAIAVVGDIVDSA